MKPLEYYTTCTGCDEESDKETELTGVGEYCEESNTLYIPPCPECGKEMVVMNWLDECDDCGELHYAVDGCEGESE